MNDAFEKKQNDFPHDTEEERVLLKSVAEAWINAEQTEIELSTLGKPDPEYSENFWNAMNDVAKELNNQKAAEKSESASTDIETPSTNGTVLDNRRADIHQATNHVSLTKGVSFRRFLVAAVVVCMLAGLPLIAAANGIKFFQLFQSKNESSMDIGYRADDAAAVKGIYYLSKLPDGYVMLNQEINSDVVKTIYGDVADETKPSITLCQFEEAPNFLTIDQEGLEEKTVKIGNVTGKCYSSDEKSIISWEMGDVYFQLISTVPSSQLISIANSVIK